MRRMEPEPRFNRGSEPAADGMSRPDLGLGNTAPMRRSGRGPLILVVTIVVVLIVLGVVFKDKLKMNSTTSDKKELGVTAAYQAVFLTNGQVYFGMMGMVSDKYLTLDNIYYLQVTPVLQTKTEGEPGAAPAQQQQLSLVKLGNELHGPADRMVINRDQVLFFEDLKDDGRVVQAIKQYEEDQKKK